MQKSYILIDIDTQSQIDDTGAFIRKSTDYPSIERGQWQILCMEFKRRVVDAVGAVTLQDVNLSGSSFVLVADIDFDDANGLMFKSIQSSTAFAEDNPESNRFNIQGDWIDDTTADLTKGQVSFRVNTNTAKFKSAINGKKSVTAYLNLKQYTTGISNPSTIAWLPFTAKNTIKELSSEEEIPPEGINLVSYINAYFSDGFELQFSVDGSSNWHTTQATDDRYYRMRVSGTEANWTTAIQMPVGSGSGSGMTETEIKDYVDTKIDEKFENLATTEW